MRHRGGGGGTDKRNGDRAAIIRGMPMDGATHHLGAQLLVWVLHDGMRLENTWAELFTKRRRDSCHHQAPHVGHDGSLRQIDRRGKPSLQLDLTRY